MQHQAATAYRLASQKTASPRELEAALLLSAAARLQFVVDSGQRRAAQIAPAMAYNYKLWRVLLACALRGDSSLPAHIRQSVTELALFVIAYSAKQMRQPTPEALLDLIDINRTVAVGLRG